MNPEELDTEWVERFPGLSRLEPTTKKLLLQRSTVVSMPETTVIFGPGKSPENMLFLLSGTVRVQQVSETGHEIVLYRINAGESCVLTTACVLAYDDYSKASRSPRSEQPPSHVRFLMIWSLNHHHFATSSLRLFPSA